MDCASISLAVLAAGRSQRFGQPKLAMMLGDERLGCVTAARLAHLPFCARVAVIAPDLPDVADRFDSLGFQIVVNDAPDAGLSHSLALAVTRLRTVEAEGLLICLADMPNVSVDHILRLTAAASERQAVASSLASVAMPPALFPRHMWDDMQQITGDAGARHLLASALLIQADDWTLRDIDTPDALAEVSRAYLPARARSPDPS